MKLKILYTKFILSAVIIYSLAFSGIAPKAQDLVPTEDLSLGSSVFVFRKSRTSPQFKSTTRRYFLRNPSAMARRQSRRNITAVNRRNRTSGNSIVAAKNRAGKRRTAPNGNKLSETLTAKADALLENKEIDQAILTYKAALKNNPQNADAKSGLSEALSAKGEEFSAAKNYEEAGKVYLEAAGADDKNYAPYIKLAQMDEESGQLDGALTHYQKALQLNPKASELFGTIASLYYQKEDLATAESYLAKAEVSGDNNNAGTVFLRGLIYFKRNENEKALAAFEKTLALDGNYLEAYLYQAETLERLNRESEALAVYQKTVEVNPEFVQGWFDLGVANYNRQNYREAETAYLKVIELDKNNSTAHANLASVYRQMEKYSEANGEYKLAAEEIRDDADLFSEWGYCLGKVNDWEKAIARLQTAKDLSPDTIDYTNLGWGYYNAAQRDIDADKKNESQAKLLAGKQILQKAVEINPNFDAAQLNLGVTYNGLGEYQNAVETLTKANSLHRDWKIGINELGVAYRKLNKLTDAVNQFQKAVNLDANFALGLFNLGEAQSKLGRKKDAQQTLKRLKQVNPELARKLDNIVKGVIIDEAKEKIRSKIPRLPF